MASKQINARIQLKRDTASNWQSRNPIILNGELILVDTASGETRCKIGDGTKTYSQLPFEDEVMRGLIAAKVSSENGKGLSTNDFTTAYRSKLDGVSEHANNYVLPVASESILGGVRIGSDLKITNGVLSVVTMTAAQVDAILKS